MLILLILEPDGKNTALFAGDLRVDTFGETMNSGRTGTRGEEMFVFV